MELAAGTIERPPEVPEPSREDGSEAGDAAAVVPQPEVIPAEELAESTDDLLVRAAVAGQREAFAELVRRYANLLFWFARGRVGDAVEVEEVAQEALVRAFEGLPRLRVPRAFPNWLLTIADNIVREKHRFDSKIIYLESPAAELEAPEAEAESLSQEEFRAKLADEMQRLPAHYRTVLALKYMNSCSVEEIAKRLQVPEGTVRGRLSRAYGILRARLGSLAPWASRSSGTGPGAAH